MNGFLQAIKDFYADVREFFAPPLPPSEDASVWEEIWYYLYTNYFSAEDVYYENIKVSSSSMVDLRRILLGLLIGLLIASVAMTFNKRVLGEFIRAVLSGGATSPEDAKTLEELGFGRKYIIRRGVRKGINVRCVVKCREEEEFYASLEQKRSEYEEKRKEDPSLPPFKAAEYSVDPDEDHFYIPEEKKYSAEMRFDKRGSSWGTLIAVIVVCVVLFVALLFLIPQILKLVDGLAGIM